jgi:hypothetical protein
MLSTIVSYPERGEGGKNSYRGNCSPKLIEDLVQYFQPQKVFDPMVGSGTTRDVCQRLGVSCDVLDLNPAFGGWDATRDEIPGVYDLVFWHPPYSDIIKYSGSMWGKPDPRDLSQIPLSEYPRFIDKLNLVQFRLYQSLKKGGRIAILVGDVKKNGRLYSIQRDMDWLGQPEQVIIKSQHNCFSDRKNYVGKFIPIVHEYLLIFKKTGGYIISLRKTILKECDIRTYENCSWRTAVRTALEALGGQATLQELYKELEPFVINKKHKTPDAKIRETIYRYPEFEKVRTGTFRLAAA